MRLNEIRLDGFGRLVNRTFQFSPGFNLIFGLNEAGKSTLQQAMLALLYGFLSEGRIKEDERAILAAFRPWDERTSYQGTLLYTLDDGQTFQVTRTFGSKPQTTLTTQPGHKDVSKQFGKASEGRLFFADVQLGMSKEIFENTCTVRQAELVALEASATAITDTLMRLSASASTDTKATEAIAALEKMLTEEIGTQRASKKPLPKARKHLEELEKERSQMWQKRQELFAQIAGLNQDETRLQQLDLARQQMRYLQKLAEQDELCKQITRANDISTEINRLKAKMDQWEEYAAFPIHLNDQVMQLTAQHQHLSSECHELRQKAETAQEALASVEQEMNAAQARVDALGEAKTTPAEELPRVRELADQWKLAKEAKRLSQERWQKTNSPNEKPEENLELERTQLEPAIKLGHTGLAGLQQQLFGARQRVSEAAACLNQAHKEWTQVGMSEAEFQALEHQAQEAQFGLQPAPKPRKGCGALFSSGKSTQTAYPTPPEVITYTQLKPIYTDWLNARNELASTQQVLSHLEEEVRNHLGELIDHELSNNAFEQLGQRLERHQRAEIEIKQKEAARNQLKDELNDANQSYDRTYEALRVKLAGLGFEVTDLQIAWETYLERCEQKTKLEREEAELERLRLRAQNYQSTIEQWEGKQNALARTEAELIELLAQANINGTTEILDSVLTTFQDGVKNHNHWQTTKLAYESATNHQITLAEAKTIEELESNLAEVNVSLAKMQGEHSNWDNLKPDKAAQEYATLIQQADQDWFGANKEYDRLKHEIEQITNNLKHPAELDEEVGLARATVQRLEWSRDVLELARQELSQATQEFQRRFAPKIEQVMSDGLTHITRGRYSRVEVDPHSLAISLTAPEFSNTVSAEALSTGTRDLIYLMLRVAIAQVMSRAKEKLPLLLDDPLVQCDRGRQEQALTFLSQLAEETQVFLFTKDEWIKGWFEEKLSGSSLYRGEVLD